MFKKKEIKFKDVENHLIKWGKFVEKKYLNFFIREYGVCFFFGLYHHAKCTLIFGQFFDVVEKVTAFTKLN